MLFPILNKYIPIIVKRATKWRLKQQPSSNYMQVFWQPCKSLRAVQVRNATRVTADKPIHFAL